MYISSTGYGCGIQVSRMTHLLLCYIRCHLLLIPCPGPTWDPFRFLIRIQRLVNHSPIHYQMTHFFIDILQRMVSSATASGSSASRVMCRGDPSSSALADQIPSISSPSCASLTVALFTVALAPGLESPCCTQHSQLQSAGTSQAAPAWRQ